MARIAPYSTVGGGKDHSGIKVECELCGKDRAKTRVFDDGAKKCCCSTCWKRYLDMKKQFRDNGNTEPIPWCVCLLSTEDLSEEQIAYGLTLQKDAMDCLKDI